MKKTFILLSSLIIFSGCSSPDPSPTVSYYPSMEEEWLEIKSDVEKRLASQEILDSITKEEKEELLALANAFKDSTNTADLEKIASLFNPESPGGMMIAFTAQVASSLPEEARTDALPEQIDSIDDFRIIDGYENWRLFEFHATQGESKNLMQFVVVKKDKTWLINDLFQNDGIERKAGFLSDHVNNLPSFDNSSAGGSFSFESEPGDFTFELDESLQ